MTPKSTVQCTTQWNRTYLPTGGTEKVYLLIEAKGNGQVKVDRAPVNLSLVLDRSGSMTGSPLEFSKKACQFVVDQMTEKDLLNMVAFDDEIQTVFEPQSVIHKDIMKQKIGAIETCGCTNLSGGLIEGAQYVKGSQEDGSVQRVILLSDGHANRGVTDANKLASIAKEYSMAVSEYLRSAWVTVLMRTLWRASLMVEEVISIMLRSRMISPPFSWLEVVRTVF